MNPYFAIVSARFRTLIQYRAAALAGMATQLFWGLIRSMIFGAFYRSTTAPQPLSYPQIVTYIWLGQALLALLPWGVDTEVRDNIRSGAVAYEMLRPLDLYSHWFCRAVAQRTAPTLLRSVPLIIVAGLFLGLQAPASHASALAFAAALVGALFLSASFTTLMSVSMMWTISGDGMLRIAQPLVYTLSGMLIPLTLLPAWTQPIVNALPFRGMVDVPFRIYMGSIPASGAVSVILQQLAWSAALIIVGRIALSRGKHRLVVQGG